MKNIRLLLVSALLGFASSGAWGQNTQWDVYNVIPYYKNTSFIFDSQDAWDGYSFYSESQGLRKYDSGKKLGFTIYDDYSVTLDYSSTMLLFRDDYRWSNIPIHISGTGIVRWQNDRLVIDLSVQTSTTGGSDHGSKYEGTRQGDVYSTEEYSFPSYSDTKKYSYVLEYADGQGFRLIGNDIMSVITGTDHFWADNGVSRDVPIYYQICLKLTQRFFYFNAVEKSQSELNEQTSDPYGKWQWNDDRSEILLESAQEDANWVIWNRKNKIGSLRNSIEDLENDTTLRWDLKQSMIEGTYRQIQEIQDCPITWGVVLNKNGSGYKTEITDDGEELTYLMIPFDGGSEQSFSFVVNRAQDDLDNNMAKAFHEILAKMIDQETNYSNHHTYEYVQYDRFMGTLKRDASILNQIKDKRIMIVNYKQNGSDKTTTFQLEGLEAIYNAITQ